ncbi:MAG: glycosyltransferase [Woeseia sp.]|nr:glycosyltransferase [Gammaproteobacteria bacterium]NNE61917.1 glycosyltransferase [Woeseia sp.]
MRHVALVTTSYPDDCPGAEAAGSFVEDFARELARHVRVTVVAAGSATSVTASDGFEVRRFGVPKLPLSTLKPGSPSDWPAIFSSLRSGQRAVSQLFDDKRPDHLFALWALPAGYWAQQCGRRHGIPFSTWALGSDIWTLGKVPVVRRVLRSVLRNSERRYADGLQLAEDVTALCGMPCEFMASTRRLPSSGSGPRQRTGGRTFAFLGRWHRNKGIDLLLDALDMLGDEDWAKIDAVRIFGGGPYRGTVHQRAGILAGLGRPVSVGGFLDKPAAAALIESVDFLLLPSRIESIPVIFSDAMQLRTPIVSTPVGDLPRLFDKYRVGVLASSVDPDAFAEAIRRALAEDIRSFDESVSRASQDFDLTGIVDRFVENLWVPAS